MAVARYVSGSGTDRLRFEYVIMLDDYDDNGIGRSLERDSESPFRLDGAAIVDAVAGGAIGVDLRWTTLTGGGGNHRVEARPPVATGVAMASSPASGDTYGAGETVTVRLTMREDVTVLLPGRPHVWLEVGGAVRRAEYSGPVGSATRTLEFSYTVQESDFDTDGVRLCSRDRPGIDCGRIHLNGGTIRAARGGLDAALGTPNQSAQAGHKVGADRGLTLPTSGNCSTEIKVPYDWALKPSGVGFGGKFRLLFVSSTTAAGPVTTSDVYSGRMQALAGNGHQAIRRYKDGFRVLVGYAGRSMRAESCTTGAGTGIGIYWLNGERIATSYSDLYDGSWSSQDVRNEHGAPRGAVEVWTGTNNTGGAMAQPGFGMQSYGNPFSASQPLNAGSGVINTGGKAYYGLSQVFTVPGVRTTAWSLLSTPVAGNTYRRGETIEVAIDFSEAVTVFGTPVVNLAFGDNPSNLAGQVGAYLRGSGTSRLIFGYRVAPGIRDTTGLQFSDKPIELRGGSIRAVSDNFPAVLTIPAWNGLAPSQNVDGRLDPLTGGVCERTPQVRDALVAKAGVSDCSEVGDAQLAGIAGALRLEDLGIAALKPGDFAGLSGVTTLLLSDNALSALPAGVFDGLGAGRSCS